MATIARTTLEPGAPESSRSAVSWPAIFAGAVAALGTTLILLALGSGMGFAAASPWPGAGASAKTFAIGAGIWLIVMQWLSSAMGGYIAGRLRTRWTGLHTREVFFRDTAHGFLAWGASTILVAAITLSATAATLGTVASTTSAATYAGDTLLRTDHPAADASAARAEITRILEREGPVASDDRTYLTHVVARETGVSQSEAERRVDAATASVRQAADTARKTSSAVSFFTALSLLIGAFIASVAAAYAGKLRDDAEGALP